MKNDLKGKVNGVANVPNNEQGSGYFSNIEKENDRVLILENKAVVEIENTYVGYIGWHKKCLLYKDGHGFKIWIEGKKTYKCELLRAPQEARTVGLVTVTINEVLRDGKFLKLSDGRILTEGEAK